MNKNIEESQQVMNIKALAENNNIPAEAVWEVLEKLKADNQYKIKVCKEAIKKIRQDSQSLYETTNQLITLKQDKRKGINRLNLMIRELESQNAILIEC